MRSHLACVKRSLPPLSALRAFEAAGRHLSFTRAAEELCVTQGAVSRQIKLLEEHLSQKLFNRLTRQVELTPFGADYLHTVDTSFGLLEKAAAPAAASPLRISVNQSLANLWLLPRLSEFTERHFDVHVETSFAPVSFAAGGIDAAIRLGRLPGARYRRGQPEVPHDMVRSWRGVIAEHLCDEVLTPAVSPKLVASRTPLTSPGSLLKYKLIGVTSRPNAWRDWLGLHDIEVPAASGMEYGHFFLALEAASARKGIAIAPTIFLGPYLATGKLFCPFKAEVKSAGAYYLLYPERGLEDRRVQALKQWLTATVKKTFRER